MTRGLISIVDDDELLDVVGNSRLGVAGELCGVGDGRKDGGCCEGRGEEILLDRHSYFCSLNLLPV